MTESDFSVALRIKNFRMQMAKIGRLQLSLRTNGSERADDHAVKAS